MAARIGSRISLVAMMALVAAGAPAHFYCGARHFCRAGHGHHFGRFAEDLTPVLVVEYEWIAPFALALAVAVFLPIPRRIFFALVLFWLVFSRIVMESSFVPFAALPMGALAVTATYYAIRPAPGEEDRTRA